MKTYQSKTLTIGKPQEEIYGFLSDFRNFGKLMPSEISNWQADETSCSFTITNMADLNMTFGDCTPNDKIVMKSHGKNPFSYDLNVHIADKGDSADVHIVFNADLNPMLAMMVSNPLKNFINTLVEKLKETLE
jgi:carbon monoxide dehydrogenase subunit G